MPDNEKIGERIKKLRTGAHLTQEELAKAVGVDRSTIAQYENGSRRPRDNIKAKIADVLGTGVEPLFFKKMK